jgi:arsenate reductase-like glutaredoxin family protein
MEKIIWVNVETIIPNPNNPRTISVSQMEKLEKSIEQFPKMLELRPIVIDENNMVLGGNMRLQALVNLGYKEVPVVKVSELTEAQKKEFVIKDNVGYGDWNWEQLHLDWELEVLDDWGLSPFNSEDTLTNHNQYEGLDAASKLDKFMNAEIKRLFLVFDSETFTRVVNWFEEKQTEFNVEDNSQVILKLMEK